MTIILFTRQNGLNELCPGLTAKIPTFCQNNKDLIIFWNDESLMLVDRGNNFENKSTCTPLAILVNDTLKIEDIKPILEALNNQVNDIYVIYHENTETEYNNHRDKLPELFGAKIKGNIPSSHQSGSAFQKVFSIIDSFDEKAFNRLKLLFPDPYLESLIHLHKSLSITKLKIGKGILRQDELSHELTRINESNKEKVKLAFDKYNIESFSLENLNSKLADIEKEVTEISAIK